MPRYAFESDQGTFTEEEYEAEADRRAHAADECGTCGRARDHWRHEDCSPACAINGGECAHHDWTEKKAVAVMTKTQEETNGIPEAVFTVDTSDVLPHERHMLCLVCGNSGKWGGCKEQYGCGRKRVIFEGVTHVGADGKTYLGAPVAS